MLEIRSIEDILRSELLLRMVGNVYEALGIPIDVYSTRHETIFPTLETFSPFCSLLRNAYGESLCKKSDECLMNLSIKNKVGIKKRCPFGFLDFCAPVFLSSCPEHIGIVFAGQVRDNSSIKRIDFDDLARKSGHSKDDLISQYEKIPVVNREYIRLAPAVLTAFAKNLGQLAEHELEKQKTFLETSSVFNRFYSRKFLYQVILESVCKVSNANMGCIFIADWLQELLMPVETYGDLWSSEKYSGASELNVSFKEGIIGRVFNSGKAEIVENISGMDDYYSLYEEVKSVMAIPIFYGGDINGVILLLGFKANQFNKAGVHEAETFLTLATAGLPFAILTEYVSKLNEGLASLSRNNLLNLTLPIISNLFGYSLCSVWLLEKTKRNLILSSNFGYRSKQPFDLSIPLNDSYMGKSIQENEITIISNINYKRDTYLSMSQLEEEGITKQIIVPLKSKENSLGVLNLYSKRPKSLSNDNRELLKIISDLLSSSLYQLELMQQLNEQNRNIIKIGRVSFAGSLSLRLVHRVKSSLKSFRKSFGHINDSPLIKGTELSKMSLDCLKQIETLSKIVDETLPLVREIEPQFTLLDLSGIVKTAREQLFLSASIENVKIEIELPKEPVLGYTDRFLLLDILTCLVTNSIEAHARNVIIKVKKKYATSGKGEKEYAVIEVEDNGIGLPQDQFERVFDAGTTSKKIGVGTGLGLYLSREFARLSNGDIQFVKSERNKSTIIAIFLLS